MAQFKLSAAERPAPEAARARRIAVTRQEAGLAFALVLASAGTVDQYLGIPGVLAYAAVAFAAVPVVLRLGVPLLLARLDERVALLAAAATLVALAVAFAFAYPRLNVHTGLRGSDRDDAANLAARQLMHLQFPYSKATYLGNLISQLPGAVVLAVPFVALGTSAYQNLFWLAVFYVVLRKRFADARLALAALWIAVLGAPGVLRELVTGGDLIANAAYLVVFSLGVLAGGAGRRARALRLASAVGLGLALSSRANALLVVPLLFAVIARRDGARAAVARLGLALGVCLAVTLPFYAWNPGRFTPLLTADKIGRFEDLLPHATAIVTVCGGLLALAVAYHVAPRPAAVLRALAFIEGALFSASVLLSSVAAHGPDLSFLLLGYGIFALIPAVAGLWDGTQ